MTSRKLESDMMRIGNALPTGGGFPMMKYALALAICFSAAPAFASCKSEAADKKLAGAALASFMTKCEKDAAAACEADSTKQKLSGAAKVSHVTKCVAEKVGSGATPVMMTATCKAEATEKKLAGAALTSFMTKCEKDALAACEADSTKQKLQGAAKASHTKRCVADRVGT
jgi:hypothetical protein